jgi:phospholipid transport system substrate-binding protein
MMKNPNEYIARSSFKPLLIAMVVGATLLPSQFIRNALANDPMPVVKTSVNQALATLRDNSIPLKEKQVKLRLIVSSTFDFTEMAKSAMGPHWRDLTPEQRKEFSDVFVTFIEDSYLSKINDYRSQDVVFVRARNDGPDYAQVDTRIVQAGDDPIDLNFQLGRSDDTWKIYDVTVDAVSIIANYRNQFNRIMNSQGYDTLIEDLKSKQKAAEESLANH